MFFLGEGPLLYLYTGRHAWDVMPADDMSQFHYPLLDHGVSYIFLEYLPALNVPKSPESAPLDRAGPWLFKAPRHFTIDYENRDEVVWIF